VLQLNESAAFHAVALFKVPHVLAEYLESAGLAGASSGTDLAQLVSTGGRCRWKMSIYRSPTGTARVTSITAASVRVSSVPMLQENALIGRDHGLRKEQQRSATEQSL